MALELALIKMKELLKPSGRLLILGLYEEVSVLDYFYSAISVHINRFYLRWHGVSNDSATEAIAPTRPT